MEVDLLSEGLLISPALMAWLTEDGPRPPPPPPPAFPGQDHYLDYGGDRSGKEALQLGCPPLLNPGQPREHSGNATLKLPKREEPADLDLPVAAMETTSDRVRATAKRLSLPLPLPSRASPPLSPAPLPPPFRSVDQLTLRGTARPTPQQLIHPSTGSRGRRWGIGERMRLLAKLMPWDRKMTTSSMLEEARKYVQFLEAQVAALQCMPLESRFGCPPPSSYAALAPVLRGLEELNRQQLLHVLVRSPLVQEKLCARSLCVFAAEQVILLRHAEMNKMLQQQQQREQHMALDCGSSSTLSD